MMTDSSDDGMDLTPLRRDAVFRASRIVARVVERVELRRRAAARTIELRAEIGAQLGRVAVPSMLAAAASIAAVFLISQSPPGSPDRFAVVLLGPSAATQWIVVDRPPGIAELAAMLAGTP